jgi:hypothetical protein|tara:strand:- start:407 stop:784 length:378 start_codon:yes stop_codon:yes gene_type:complete
MAAPNLVNVTSITGKIDGHALTTDAIDNANSSVITAASNKLIKINSIIVANVDGTNSVNIDVAVNLDSDARFYLAKTVALPADSTLVVIGKDSPIYLEEGDELEARASEASDAELVVSYEILDDA